MLRLTGVVLAMFAVAACGPTLPPAGGVPLIGVEPDSMPGYHGNGWRFLAFGLLDLHLPTSTLTALIDGEPVRMHATVIDLVMVPPQGRDTLSAMGRRMLLVWEGTSSERYFMADGSLLPAPIPKHAATCCTTPEEARELRLNPYAALALPKERLWQAAMGIVTIHPPKILSACEPRLRNGFVGLGVMRTGCRRARFDVALDVSLRQTFEPKAAPGRVLAIAPTRVQGVQVFIDCRVDPGALDFFCGNLP